MINQMENNQMKEQTKNKSLIKIIVIEYHSK